MRIAVVGTGYVGLVVGACLAENGNEVICVDNNAPKVRSLKRGRIPIYEPGLEELVVRNQREKRLSFSTALPRAVRASQIVFIAVGTPPGDDGAADLKYVVEVARNLARAMNGYKVIVNKSTVPVGTAAQLRETIRRETIHPFSVVSNPEFLKQGAALADFMRPDRVELGVEDPRARELLRAMAADHRIGPAFLFPGVGYGGSCFPKDVRALLRSAEASGYKADILKAIESVNSRQKSRLISKIRKHFTSLKGKIIAVWGLSFKPNTDDMREAPSVTIIEGILSQGGKVRAYDPEAEKSARSVFGSRIEYVEHSYEALTGADALAIVTEWNEFREPDFARMRSLMKSPVVFDGRNLFTNEQMRSEGFTYYSIGR